jgi:hypothetical protein
MKKTLTGFFVFCSCLIWTGTYARNTVYTCSAPTGAAAEPQGTWDDYSPQQLDNLVAPIALYPDPLLAQVLLASTFADEIGDAAQWLRAGNNPDYVDTLPWDVSVKAVAHYPSVLYMMNDRMDWTAALGQAYVSQSTDVMLSIQRLRRMAHSAGNLQSTPQHQVIVEGAIIHIVPYHPRYIYVPIYDPAVIYHPRRHTGYGSGVLLSFSAGFAIGVWLNHDFDWGHHRIFYHGWQGGGWVARSRPNVHITNIYVNESRRNVVINRTIVNRHVNYSNLGHYNSVHPDVKYSPRAIHAAPGAQANRHNESPRRDNGNIGMRPQIRRADPQPKKQPHEPQVRSNKGEKGKTGDKNEDKKHGKKGERGDRR